MDRRDFLRTTAGAAAGSSPFVGVSSARAQGARGALVAISESGWNGLDPHVPGAAFANYGVAWNCYDRLVAFGTKKDPETNLPVTDGSRLEPGLAEEWHQQGLTTVFKLRKDAVFQDGTPVRARDVKWSLDRCIGVGGIARFQLKAGSMEDPAQVVVVDDHTLRIDLPNANPLVLANFAVPLINIYNSELVKSKATAGDPWGLEFTKANVAGSGAFKVASFTSDTMGFVRFDGWKLGRPSLDRAIWRIVPSASTRRALLERGDADISNEFPPRDIADMKSAGKLAVYATPLANCGAFLAMNLKAAPFDNPKVREAMACVIPYDKIQSAALFNTARTLAGGSAKVTSAQWPQAGPYAHDIAKAKQLLEAAGLPNGFDTTLSFDLGNGGIMEPLCVLIQESLAQIGVKVTLERIPGANWRSTFISRKAPLLVNAFNSFLDYPHYYYDFVYGKTSIFNSMNYDNPKMEQLLAAARQETDPAAYAELTKAYIQLGYDDLPAIPIYQPYQYIAAQKNVSGYQPAFHRQIDFRTLSKT